MNDSQIHAAGQALHEAWRTRRPMEPLTAQCPGLSLDDAYRIQQVFVDLRLEAGERVVGKKIGVTSRPVMEMLKVYQPDFGYLLDGMCRPSYAPIALDGLIQPKAEGELAFVLKKDLLGPGISNADVLAATEGVMACFEIVDSRIRDWKIAIQDTVADNASCGLFVLGERLVDPRSLDLSLCGMVLEKNGEVAVTGAGAAALGHPVNAVAWLANTLGRFGIPLKAGEVILSGALGAMVPVARGDFLRVSIGGVGHCSLRFD
ncbi:2-oxopent-4-enoate hydratase [Pseudomonas sp. JH-2]|uniref:2-oxopent-4-enoate hydratase n=1 Tax=Pseudomonas sp. JH-2 TaxID=3114998 RepID=UPI002E26CE21|nr:2-oxopent-4-enoate hydratase [Pseudomonas sp. JH-2]